MPPLIIPLYYQLLEAYHPVSYYSASPQVTINTISPTPAPVSASFVKKTSNLTIALLGDSMIDTLSVNTCQQSFNNYFPNFNINLLKYGYGSTNIESGLKRLTETTSYLGKDNPSILSQNPDIIVIESFAYNNYGNSQSGIDRHSAALKKMIDTINEQSPHPKIVLAATIAPNSISYGNGLKNYQFSALEKVERTSTIKLYLQNIIRFATQNKIPLADAFHPSLFGQDGLDSLISSGDHLHPSPLGSQLFCDTIAKSIRDNRLLN